jgi:hypothetical protein
MTITPVTQGFSVRFSPGSGFFASANNLAGGKTSIFSGTLSFDITFDSPIRLTANIFEDGIYSVSGPNSRASVNAPDLASGVVINQLDSLLAPERIGNSYRSNAIVNPFNVSNGNSFSAGSGVWFLYDQATGFSKTYQKYHVVIDNDLIAESSLNILNSPGFAAVAKKDFSIVFTLDGSGLGGPPLTPEPSSLGTLLAAVAGILALRRRAS